MRKNVSFPVGPVSAVIAMPGYYENEDRWLSRSDFKKIRRNAEEIAKQAWGSGLTRLLEGTFCVSTSTTHSSSSKQSKASIDPLILWCRHVRMRRGLEQLTSPEHASDRLRKQKLLIQSVVSNQDRLKQSSSSHVTIEEELSKVSMLCSTDAVAFARRLGNADEAAAMLEHQNAGHFSTSRPSGIITSKCKVSALYCSRALCNTREQPGTDSIATK